MFRAAVLACLFACGSSSSGGVDSARPTADGRISGPLGEWVFYEVPGAICANGSATGVGVNQGAGDKVIIYMSGGSACLDDGCNIGTPSMRKTGGFGAAQMAACAAGDCDGGVTFPDQSFFDRAAGASPFTDATFVFISNCAGDYYVGDKEHVFPTWTAKFQGSRNQALFAAEIAASFPAASRIVLTGGSAGSVGALLNYWQWVKAFPQTRVDLISDSFALAFVDGPEWRYAQHAPRVPPDCAGCAADYRAIYDFNASLSPTARIAVLDSENNFTLDLLYPYSEGLTALQPRLDALANTKYYVANGNVHILVQHPLASAAIDVQVPGGGTHQLAEFLTKMQSDDPAWQSYSCLSN